MTTETSNAEYRHRMEGTFPNSIEPYAPLLSKIQSSHMTKYRLLEFDRLISKRCSKISLYAHIHSIILRYHRDIYIET